MADEQKDRQDVDYWVEHAGALGLRSNVVLGVLTTEDRKTFTESQVKDLCRKALKREVPPYDGAPEHEIPVDEEGEPVSSAEQAAPAAGQEG